MSPPNPPAPSTRPDAGTVPDEDLLLDLLDRWEQERRSGREPTAEELCPQSTELQAQLRERIRRRRRLDALLVASEQPADPVTVPAVAGYEVLEEVGRGGMGVVYKARHLGLNRVVALKMLLGGGLADSEARERFRTEAEAVARLQHPNIVQIHDVGFHDGQPYLALEHVGGGSLAERLGSDPQPPRDGAKLVEALAQAVQHAHEKGVVHRDLKPANILLQRGFTAEGAEDAEEKQRGKKAVRGGEAPPRLPASSSAPSAPSAVNLLPKIADFGLAKQLDGDAGRTRTGAVMGTPSYMAPEQAAGKVRELGPAVDVYALGAILYECLTGRPPFKGTSLTETLDMVRNQEPVPVRRLQPRTPRDLETITLKCLRKEPRRRYGSARGLADDLRRFLDGRPITARPVSAWERAARWAWRNPSAAALIAVSVSALVGLFVLIVTYSARLTRERDEARDQRGKAERALALAVQTGAVLDDLGMKFFERNVQDKTEQTFRMAADAMTQNLKLLDAMVAEAPDNADVRAALAQSLQNRGDLYAARGKLNESEADLQRALAQWELLRTGHPDRPEFATGQALTRVVLGRMQFYQQRNHDAAFDRLNEAIPVLEPAVRVPRVPELVRFKLTAAYVARAHILLARGKPAEALADWEAALADATLGTGTLRYKYEFNRVYVLAVLGRRDEAVKAAESLRHDREFRTEYFTDLAEIYALCARARGATSEADTDAAHAVAALREAVATGHLKGAQDADALAKNPALSALVGRPDFEELLAKLRKP